MKPKVGQYYYAPHGRFFHIYRWECVTETGGAASPVPDEPRFINREEARKRVYELNGWNYKPLQK